MPRVGVILSGCGVFDGAEIHEAVITLLCLDQQGASYQCMAPRKPLQVIDHLQKEPEEGATRDVLTESARIARGDILDLADVEAADYDAFILPGGFGAAKNLCDFATAGPQCEADPEVTRVLQAAQETGKPLGFACIAPAVAARVFGNTLSPTLTIGQDEGTAAGLEAMGAKHRTCAVDDVVVDRQRRIVSTPAYMEAQRISEVYTGINKLVTQVLELIETPVSA